MRGQSELLLKSMTKAKKMNDKLADLIKEKSVLVLGFGREGRSTLSRLLNVGGYRKLTVSDAKDVGKDIPEGVGLVFGEGYLDCIDDYDVVFKSPGIVLPKDASLYRALITSQTDVFIQTFKEKIIGITGTKGKSTTSSLLFHVLKEAGLDVLFAGNIGIPVFEIADSVKENTVIVIELSCHQLEFAKISPHRALLLNIYEDHLDHYGTREKYAAAKKNIYLHQNKDDILYTNSETLEAEVKTAPSKIVVANPTVLPIKSFDEVEGASLKGDHNLMNASFVYLVTKEFGVSDDTFIRALSSFETLPHRLQKIGCFAGVDYYDDSISTTVKSTISAVESIKNSSILLLGGMERNIAYEELVEYLSHSKLEYLICMYESGKRLYEMYEKVEKSASSPRAILVTDLNEAVKSAVSHSKAGGAVLLSPASASYGYFKNFEERGEVFEKLVKNSY